MNLKNYTSDVPSSKSIMKIEQLLVQVGAKNINKEYENGVLKALIFLVDINIQTLVFKVPAKIEVVEKVLKKNIKRPRAGTWDKIATQAEKTAWKIVCDWVEIQCTMIHLEQAELAEVFLPYAFNPDTNSTLWDRIKQSDLKLLK